MKTIGIVGAMDSEISLLKSNMELISAKQIIGVDFYMGKMSGKNIVLVRSRVGKVNAAICTQVMIDLYGVDYVINTGVAGAISKDLDVGDIVISSDLVHHDFDTTAIGEPIGVNTSISESFFKADEELIRIAKEACNEVIKDNNIFVGRIGTGDQFVSNPDTKQRIWDNFNVYCTEMEGAAIAQTCYLNKIPFVVIRAISDKADEDANISFETFVKMAAENSSNVVEQMLKAI